MAVVLFYYNKAYVTFNFAKNGQTFNQKKYLTSVFVTYFFGLSDHVRLQISFDFAKNLESRSQITYSAQTCTWNFGTGLFWYFY